MTIEQFSSLKNVKIQTVRKWVKEGLIPKADIEKNFVPDSARCPFTNARAKNTKAIYISMVKAAYNKKHILPVLYGICDDEFDGYVHRLIQAGFLEKRIRDGVVYYDATIKAGEINQRFILEAIKAVSRGVSEGIASAVLNS